MLIHTTTGYGENLSERSYFFDKNFQFLSKKITSPQKSPSRTPFERSEKQCLMK